MSDLSSLVAERIDSDSELTADAGLLVLAALESDEALADMAGFAPPDPVAAEADPVEPAGAYLRQISVEGFRGIGPRADLDLTPAPGLTIVAGRNGSGKSSFAEALEVALTATTYRWSNKRSKQWQEAWRNLHQSTAPRIKITLAEEAVGHSYVTAGWAEGAELDQMDSAVQRHGKRKEPGLGSLGWSEAIVAHRPLLTYDELGALLTAEPSRLYDALSTVLGLGQIADAIGRLAQRHKALTEASKDLPAVKKQLGVDLAGIDDQRAARAAALLRPRVPDLTALRALATGTDPGADEITDWLRRVVNVTLPSADAVTAAAEQLRAAVQELADAGDAATDALERRATLLAAAREIHAHDGDLDCPVCGEGRLDGARADLLGQELAETESMLTSLKNARSATKSAKATAECLLTPVPSVLVETTSSNSLQALRDTATNDWNHWSAPPDEALSLVDHLLAQHPVVAGSLHALQAASLAELTTRDDAWAGIASQLGAYADRVENWQLRKPEADTTKSALDWLKAHDHELKNQRLRPIAAQAIAIWTALRQESNVAIADLKLEGTNTTRRVEITSSVDGEDAAGITVLSQGELHALALALFLPRATMADSPFRFVVLDDPVQAMDPSKVDGLLTVLSAVAETRQVVVFSHDDRLAGAARRGGADATIIEVTRDEGSVVTIRAAFDPADRYLDDARAMAHDTRLPDQTKRRLLPGMLRLAVEARARDRYFSTALGRGTKPADVEASWDATRTTRSRVALAILDDPRKDLSSWLSRGIHRGPALGVCSGGFHHGMDGNVDDACRNVSRLMCDIKDGVR